MFIEDGGQDDEEADTKEKKNCKLMNGSAKYQMVYFLIYCKFIIIILYQILI